MKINSKIYEAPLCEVIELELEGAILSGSGTGTLEDIINGDNWIY